MSTEDCIIELLYRVDVIRHEVRVSHFPVGSTRIDLNWEETVWARCR